MANLAKTSFGEINQLVTFTYFQPIKYLGSLNQKSKGKYC